MQLALETELGFFEENRAAYLEKAEGKFAVIKGENLLGFFDTDEAAYKAAVQAYGIEPFLIKEVLEEDRIEQNPAYQLGLIHATL